MIREFEEKCIHGRTRFWCTECRYGKYNSKLDDEDIDLLDELEDDAQRLNDGFDMLNEEDE